MPEKAVQISSPCQQCRSDSLEEGEGRRGGVAVHCPSPSNSPAAHSSRAAEQQPRDERTGHGPQALPPKVRGTPKWLYLEAVNHQSRSLIRDNRGIP